MEQRFIAFDTETTGVEPGSRLVELAAVIFDENGVRDTFETLINPGMPIPPDVSKVHSITNAHIAEQPTAEDALIDFFDWIGTDARLIAHYACFDTGIVSWDAARFGLPIPDNTTVIDTCEIARAVNITPDNKLDTLADHYNIARVGEAHRAMSDAEICMQYFSLIDQPLSPLPWAQSGHDYGYSAAFPELLKDLPDLVATAAPIAFEYEDGKGGITERTVTPYGWASKNEEHYFHGWCHLRDARRTFRMDRVHSVTTAAA